MKQHTHSMAASCAVAAILAAVVLVGSSKLVFPHVANSGMVYPPSCCSSAITSATGDCAPIPAQSVVARADGYHVTLAVGQHPKLKTKGYSEVIPYSLARRSDDGDFHLCISQDGISRFCFFAPPPGV